MSPLFLDSWSATTLSGWVVALIVEKEHSLSPHFLQVQSGTQTNVIIKKKNLWNMFADSFQSQGKWFADQGSIGEGFEMPETATDEPKMRLQLWYTLDLDWLICVSTPNCTPREGEERDWSFLTVNATTRWERAGNYPESGKSGIMKDYTKLYVHGRTSMNEHPWIYPWYRFLVRNHT